MEITEGTQSGKQFRLKGKGMPVLRSHQRGDMYIQASVETPVNLSRRQSELLKEFEREAQEQLARNRPASSPAPAPSGKASAASQDRARVS